MDLPNIPVAQLTAPALLGITVLLILLGRLKPKSDVDRADKLAEDWRLVYLTEKAAHDVTRAQNAELLEVAKTTHSLVLAVFGSPEQTRQTGGADVVSARE